jgi:hypothetical protein
MIYEDDGFSPDPEDADEQAIRCPVCNGPVYGYLTCQTWTDARGTWMSCMGCSSAIYWHCISDTPCSWSYTEGLNSRNPRSAANEEKKPSWTPTEIYKAT